MQHEAVAKYKIFCRIIFRGPMPVAASSKHGSGAARLLGLRVRIPPSAWMSDRPSKGVLLTVYVIVCARNHKNKEVKACIWSQQHMKNKKIKNTQKAVK